MDSFLNNVKDEYTLTTLYSIKDIEQRVNLDTKKDLNSSLPLKTTAVTLPLLLTPTIASAEDAFIGIHTTVMGIFDAGVVLVIIFSGASWALGHRGKAIELLIGACCGYLLARHAVDIRDYLKKI